jgi:anthranilate synthase component 1
MIPVWREIPFDAETAVTAFTKLAEPPFAFLLESVVGGGRGAEKWARYTFLGTRPTGAWRLRDGTVEVWSPDRGWHGARESSDPLADFRETLGSWTCADLPGLPRFWGGAVGYFGYDLVRFFERLPAPPPRDLDVPDACLVFTGAVVAIDNLLGRALVIAPARLPTTLDTRALRKAYDDALARVDETIRALESDRRPEPLRLRDSGSGLPWTSTYDRATFEAHVRRIREYILAGDAFQVVLSQRLTTPMPVDPFLCYRALRTLNPSPYLYYLALDGIHLVGSSPEVMVRVEGPTVTVRPIAGTRPRGRTEDEDRRLEAELRGDEKERAEHLMLVDLGRNDVGRVSRFGTVRVPEFMVVERYSHVMHLVSQVEGTLRPDLDALDVLRACFPAGTVTGAPKVRAMEIIDELEPVRRGPYAGAVGYVTYDVKNLDTAIAIRTLLAEGERAHVQAGAGVVADSDPAREYEETLNKARALLQALEVVR